MKGACICVGDFGEISYLVVHGAFQKGSGEPVAYSESTHLSKAVVKHDGMWSPHGWMTVSALHADWTTFLESKFCVDYTSIPHKSSSVG